MVDPKVSTASMFLTKTFFRESLYAVKDRETVIVASNPSGTLATIIPIAKTKLVMALYPLANPKTKNRTPNETAIIVIKSINLFNSYFKGLIAAPALAARFAIYPITVLSPVLITIPVHLPSLHNVPKNAKF